jgi:hypothetical protein
MSAAVVRGGRERTIAAAELVRGDLIVVREGDRVPADARIVASEWLAVDESALRRVGRRREDDRAGFRRDDTRRALLDVEDKSRPPRTRAPMAGPSFERFAGGSAFATAVAGLAYSIAFVGWDSATAEGLFLLLGALLALPVYVALHQRLRTVDAGFALLALLLGLAASSGAAVHGGTALANGINPPTVEEVVATEAAADADEDAVTRPNEADPRGLATFGLTALAVLTFAWLAHRSGGLPAWVVWTGIALGMLLILVYLARLIVFDADDFLVRAPAGLAGFVANPLWYVGLGLALRREGNVAETQRL